CGIESATQLARQQLFLRICRMSGPERGAAVTCGGVAGVDHLLERIQLRFGCFDGLERCQRAEPVLAPPAASCDVAQYVEEPGLDRRASLEAVDTCNGREPRVL